MLANRSEGTMAKIGQLDARDREILKDIIQTHIISGRPVSSRTVSKHSEHSLSAASIRNVMADLEEHGLLLQPHTSSGRVPTQAAYRLYVDTLMQHQDLPTDEQRYIEENLRDAGADPESLMDAATELLSELSRQVGVVVTPAVGDTELQAMDFVPLSDRKVLCVVVATTGFVDHVVIEVEEALSREHLMRISNYVNDHFGGATLAQVRDRLLALMAEERAQVDRELASAIALAGRAVDRQGHPPAVVVRGTTTVLAQPELADVERIRQMLDAFADKARLVGLLNKCLSTDGVRVLIGEETELTSELDFSMVATCYGIGDQPLGTLGILGPSRMEYARIVSLVHFLGQTLSAALLASSKDKRM